MQKIMKADDWFIVIGKDAIKQIAPLFPDTFPLLRLTLCPFLLELIIEYSIYLFRTYLKSAKKFIFYLTRFLTDFC